jgi:hypothetical protein
MSVSFQSYRQGSHDAVEIRSKARHGSLVPAPRGRQHGPDLDRGHFADQLRTKFPKCPVLMDEAELCLRSRTFPRYTACRSIPQVSERGATPRSSGVPTTQELSQRAGNYAARGRAVPRTGTTSNCSATTCSPNVYSNPLGCSLWSAEHDSNWKRTHDSYTKAPGTIIPSSQSASRLKSQNTRLSDHIN